MAPPHHVASATPPCVASELRDGPRGHGALSTVGVVSAASAEPSGAMRRPPASHRPSFGSPPRRRAAARSRAQGCCIRCGGSCRRACPRTRKWSASASGAASAPSARRCSSRTGASRGSPRARRPSRARSDCACRRRVDRRRLPRRSAPRPESTPRAALARSCIARRANGELEGRTTSSRRRPRDRPSRVAAHAPRPSARENPASSPGPGRCPRPPRRGGASGGLQAQRPWRRRPHRCRGRSRGVRAPRPRGS